MVELCQEVKKVGGSLMVRIPKRVAKERGIREGDKVYFEPKKEAVSYFGAFPTMGPWEKEDPSVHSKYA